MSIKCANNLSSVVWWLEGKRLQMFWKLSVLWKWLIWASKPSFQQQSLHFSEFRSLISVFSFMFVIHTCLCVIQCSVQLALPWTLNDLCQCTWVLCWREGRNDSNLYQGATWSRNKGVDCWLSEFWESPSPMLTKAIVRDWLDFMGRRRNGENRVGEG